MMTAAELKKMADEQRQRDLDWQQAQKENDRKWQEAQKEDDRKWQQNQKWWDRVWNIGFAIFAFLGGFLFTLFFTPQKENSPAEKSPALTVPADQQK